MSASASLKRSNVVTEIFPMRRELKAVDDVGGPALDLRYRNFPDEEGTERSLRDSYAAPWSFVTEIFPMRRELKALTAFILIFCASRLQKFSR